MDREIPLTASVPPDAADTSDSRIPAQSAPNTSMSSSAASSRSSIDDASPKGCRIHSRSLLRPGAVT
jgi:hypothetical protein